MHVDDETRLRHMLDAAEEALRFARGKSRRHLDRDRMLYMALCREVEIIGEAAARVSSKRRKALRTIPWREVIGMRNWLAHGYYSVSKDILWKTIREDLPPLITALRPALQPERRSAKKQRKP